PMRAGSSSADGTRYGMRAPAIFFFARVMRAAMVGSLTRNARATSAVESPHSSRRVRATFASAASAGWQQVQISRSRSSAISPSTAAGAATPVIRSDRASGVEHLHRTHLDAPELVRHVLGDLDRGVEVVGLDEVEAAERLLRLEERAVGDRAAAHRARRG